MIIRLTTFVFLLLLSNLSLAGFGGEKVEPPFIEFPVKDHYLPIKWREAPINGKFTPLAAEDRSAAQKAVQRALKKYPKHILSTHLTSIAVVRSLNFYGVPYGGTYLSNTREVVIVFNRENNDTHSLLFEQCLHHEISSVILTLNQNQFDTKAWQAANPETFQYQSSEIIETGTAAVSAIREETNPSNLLSVSADLIAKGFLNSYSLVSFEQDFNELSAHLFADPMIWKYYQTSEPMKRKIDLLIDFYSRINPAFTNDYFRSINRQPKIRLKTGPLTEALRIETGWKQEHGLYVHDVDVGSSAHRNGIQVGDVLIVDDLSLFLKDRQIGDTVKVELDRKGIIRFTANLLLE